MHSHVGLCGPLCSDTCSRMCEAIYVLRGFLSRGRCKRIVNPKADTNWQILINQWTWRRQCNFKRLWKHGVRANIGRDWNWLFVCGGAPVHFRGKAITVTPLSPPQLGNCINIVIYSTMGGYEIERYLRIIYDIKLMITHCNSNLQKTLAIVALLC